MRIFSFCLSLCMLMSCQSSSPNLIKQVLTGRSRVVDEIMAHPNKYRVQILYTQIDRDSTDRPHFTSFGYRVDPEEYFYPASTVKLPAAALSLEKLRQQNQPNLDADTPMYTDVGFTGQSKVTQDLSSPDSLPSIGHYLRKIFLVSDNDAFNRLYEFLGQEGFNLRLHKLGFDHSYMLHRLSISLNPEENAHTNPIHFVSIQGDTFSFPAAFNSRQFAKDEPILLGKGEIRNGKLEKGPKDFSQKNAFPLSEQQGFLRMIMFPESQAEGNQLQLEAKDYQRLWQAMSELPRESEFPKYDPEVYTDGYAKFFMFGDSRESIPDHIRIYNKIGGAYGFLTDNALIRDEAHGIEFLLSATVYVNENGIFNDDDYQYEKLGYPFLAELGRAFYEYERGGRRLP